MVELDKISLDKAFSLFVDEVKQKGLSPSTILAYTTDLKQLKDYLISKGIINIDQVLPAMLDDYVQDLEKKGYRAVSRARKLNAYRKFFSFCKNKEFIKSSPTLGLESPKFEKSTPRILSSMEYRALRDTCRENPRTAALIEIFLQTGMKVAEVAHLSVNDVKKQSILVNKTQDSQRREIPLSWSAKKTLERYLSVRPTSKSERLFVTKNGTPLLVRNMSTILMRCFSQAEIKNASLNSLRHTWIYQQLSYGLPLQVVSHLVGHKRISTTATYLSLLEKKNIPTKTKLKEL